jgi:hypothetical protein
MSASGGGYSERVEKDTQDRALRQKINPMMPATTNAQPPMATAR